jgi:hypothetical protein
VRLKNSLSAVALSGLILAGCGVQASMGEHAVIDLGYVNGVAFPCSPMVAYGGQYHIELVVMDHNSTRFTEPTRWTAGVNHFRFAIPPGHYVMYEEQRYQGRYERVSGPNHLDVTRGVTTNINVGSFCK